MGSKSSSKSDQTTENNSTTFGIQGPNNGLILNGSGNTVTDGGAFNVINSLVNDLPSIFGQGAGMVSDGFNAVTDVARMGERQTEQAFNTAVDLYSEASDAQQRMLEMGTNVLTETGRNQIRMAEESFDFGRDSLDVASSALDASIAGNERVTTEALKSNFDVTSLVASALQNANNNNTDLASRSLDSNEYISKIAMDNASEANKDATGQLVEGFDMMMDFANDFSRSDGAALAESNNKTILFAVGGVALTVIVVAIVATRGKK